MILCLLNNAYTYHRLVLLHRYTVRQIEEGRGRVLYIQNCHHKVSIVDALIAKSILTKSTLTTSSQIKSQLI